jgi:hypothetical protein
MVTGRELQDLQSVCARLDLFEYIVAENGALLYHPATREEKLLAARPPESFLAALRAHGVSPLSVGRVIAATIQPHETQVLETIRDLGLELQVIFNKGAVMVLPAGVNKATGLQHALAQMGLSAHNAIGIGDAENDHAFLSACECAVAVANALPTLKQSADIVTSASHGAGVAELIGQLLSDDLVACEPRLARHHILLGTNERGDDVRIAPYGRNVLLVGTSGGGKSSLATGLLERLAEQGYTFCVIDPEGDYESIADAVTLGAPTRPPTLDEIAHLLAKPGASGIVNLVGLPIADRPETFASLAARLLELRARSGRPHWIVMDEAHHLVPAEAESGPLTLPRLATLLQITVHPDLLAPKVLTDIDMVIVLGKRADMALAEFGRACDTAFPELPATNLDPGYALVWDRAAAGSPFVLKIAPSHTERRRHTRKYAEGELSPDRSFFFRGPEERLKLRAQNLIMFLQLAEGVDDATWTHHLRRGDYSAWIRECIKDPELAIRVHQLEQDPDLSPQDSRARVREAIELQYTRPAG